MENLVETMCRLCLGSVTLEYCDMTDKYVRDVVGILLPHWNLDEGKHLICNDCSTKLFAAYDFKGICVNTEGHIFPYVYSKKGGLLDLREIYLKENDCKLSISEIRNVCRLCMQLIFGEFICLEQLDVNMLNTFIPEINFSSTKSPVICEACYEAFKCHSVFLTICLENEKQIKYVNDGIGGLKTEEVKVKTEEVYVKTEEVDVKTEEVILKPEEIYLKHEENEKSDLEEAVQMFECDECSFKTWNRSHLHSHALAHIQMYKCKECGYKTKKKSNLIRHALVHKDPSEVQMYECDDCSYKTRHKSSLQTHKLRHRDPSDIQMYKCDECNFKTKDKPNLLRHEFLHKDPSEVQIHKCNQCCYRTWNKWNLHAHMLRHKDPSEIEMYKCDECSFQTRRKGSLRSHMFKHTDPSEIQMYKCDECSYQTCFKSRVRVHKLIHRDPSERQMYKCEKCACQYKNKANLKYHMLKGCVDGSTQHKYDSTTHTS